MEFCKGGNTPEEALFLSPSVLILDYEEKKQQALNEIHNSNSPLIHFHFSSIMPLIVVF